MERCLALCCATLMAVCSLAGCQTVDSDRADAVVAPFERYQLNNGLTVILHVDRSDPVVAVALTTHVGSAREEPGRTGFAHLFEHLLFLNSEHLGPGGLDRLSARVGGSGANGSTSRDRTNFFQTVPAGALEKLLWAEADKLGWFINTVTPAAFAREKEVVKNEKRERVDNRPYGHLSMVLNRELYPPGHPYHTQVIGSLDDLAAASLDDVRRFYAAWYGPGNVTLTIAGDIAVPATRALVAKYFDEIPGGTPVQRQSKRPISLTRSVNVMHEDAFARLPMLGIVWPGVHRFHPDEAALDVLTLLLADGKRAPMNQILVDERGLTAAVNLYSGASELAGEISLSVQAFDHVDLDDIRTGVADALARFERDGFTDDALERIKARFEREFYEQFQSVLGKAFTLAQYQVFAGDPAWMTRELRDRRSVTRADVMRVYRQYLAGRPAVFASFVPVGQRALALDGAQPADVREELMGEPLMSERLMSEEGRPPPETATPYPRTPSAFDRRIEPAWGAGHEVRAPTIWSATLGNGLTVLGITQNELPLVRFSMVIDGGQLREHPSHPGSARLLAASLLKGTASRTTAELEDAIAILGADFAAASSSEAIRLTGRTLASRFDDTMALLIEVLTEPRFDEEEFARLTDAGIATLQSERGNPVAMAEQHFRTLIHGRGHVLAGHPLGTPEALADMTPRDIAAYYRRAIHPRVARLQIVGDVTRADALRALEPLVAAWPDQPPAPSRDRPSAPALAGTYLVDAPGAKQSVIRMGYPALARTHPDFYAAAMANYRLGGGGFASRLTQEVREARGYTYSIRSTLEGTTRPGPFRLATSVRTDVTPEAITLIETILEDYAESFGPDDLRLTQAFLRRSQARAYETLGDKLEMLEAISAYDWPHDFIARRRAEIDALSIARVRDLSSRYFDPARMIRLIVGDAGSQGPRLRDAGIEVRRLAPDESERAGTSQGFDHPLAHGAL